MRVGHQDQNTPRFLIIPQRHNNQIKQQEHGGLAVLVALFRMNSFLTLYG